MTGRLTVYAPLRVEAAALRAALPGARVVRTGVGPRAASRLPAAAGPVAVAGFCGGLDPALAPGDLVVATEVRGPAGVLVCPSAGVVLAALRRRGLPAQAGPLLSSRWPVLRRAARAEQHAAGAVAVDMESAWLLAAVRAGHPDLPVVVLRVVVDTPRHRLLAVGTLARGRAARRRLRAAAGALAEWAAATGPRTVLAATPRSFCAGVERAIDVVERALRRYGPPVYVRKQIVHNAHVVGDLQRRGAVFVDEVADIPPGSVAVFSAHGVAPAVRAAAAGRRLRVVDATCPLVAKVHAEARRFLERGDTVLLIGHAGHEEVDGTLGEAPGRILLVQSVEEAARVPLPRAGDVSYLMQTTLAVEEAASVVAALRRRVPQLRGPRSDDICYATTNRQQAVRAVAADCQLLLVVGSANSSNSLRLVETAERAGCPARLVDDETGLDPSWLVGTRTVGLTAGASAPPAVVDRVLAALAGLGPLRVVPRVVAVEDVSFALPKEVS